MGKIGVKIAAIAVIIAATVAVAQPAQATIVDNLQAGHQIYNYFDPAGSYGGSVGGWRYGPSVIINPDNSIDMWTCSPGANGAWDYIRYRHSPDGGSTWTTDQAVLTPTAGSPDTNSTCDPGVFEANGYYYLGYTSTDVSLGSNNVFVARSIAPSGPFDKWNGSGWGGTPAPFITYAGAPEEYGAGEPSFVVEGGTLYIYYTWITQDANGNPVTQNRVNTAVPTNVNWPGATTYRGVAFNRLSPPDLSMKQVGEDSSDVKYDDALGKFLSFSVADRFSTNDYVKVRESTDGINFSVVGHLRTNLQPAAHNMGVSGDGSGHIESSQSNFLAYAYGAPNSGDPFGPTWGQWSTWMSPINIINDVLPTAPELFSAHPTNGAVSVAFEATPASSYDVKYGTSPGVYTTTISSVTVSPYVISGLTNGTRYYFAVDSVNAGGTSAVSNEISGVPLNYAAAPEISATASSTFTSSWPASYLIDGNPTTTWSSSNRTAAASTEWVQVDTGANRWIKRVALTPRLNATHHYPVKFIVQASQDGTNWTNAEIPFDGALSGYVLHDGHTRQVYDFAVPIYGRYLRVTASELAADETPGVYFMQLGGVDIDQVTPTFDTIVNKNTGHLLHNTAEAYNGNPATFAENVAAVPASGVDQQLWQIESLADGYDKIVNKATGKALQATEESYNGATNASWAAVVTESPTPEQEWSIVNESGGYVKIVNHADGYVLHNTGETYNGNPGYNNVAVVADNGSDAQRWELVQQ